MRLHFWASQQGNFGDDLNTWMWTVFAPELFLENDDITFLGVGTILNDRVPRGRKQVVFGSGAGYGRVPCDYRAESWAYYAVRGPLSARALDLCPAAAVSDPAVLLPLVPELRVGPSQGTVFVPHWETAARAPWAEAARRASVELVDPREEASTVIRRIASAERVFAESLHGAIVADAFRVPWTPIICTHKNFFKWHDWTLSLGLNYRPLWFGALHSSLLRTSARRGYPLSTVKAHDGEAAATLRAFMTRKVQLPFSFRCLRVAKRLRGRIEKEMCRSRSLINLLADVGAERFECAKKHAPQLSMDRSLHHAQEEFLCRLDRLRHDYREGRIRGFRPGDP